MITREVVISARPASCPVQDPLNMGSRVTFPFCKMAKDNKVVVEEVASTKTMKGDSNG